MGCGFDAVRYPSIPQPPFTRRASITLPVSRYMFVSMVCLSSYRKRLGLAVIWGELHLLLLTPQPDTRNARPAHAAAAYLSQPFVPENVHGLRCWLTKLDRDYVRARASRPSLPLFQVKWPVRPQAPAILPQTAVPQRSVRPSTVSNRSSTWRR